MINFKSSTVTTFELVVTPLMAQQMLSMSTGNRQIRQWHVDTLAAAQQRGEWRLTHQGFAFDRNGVLRDGHHRLMACIQSGVTITILVTVGLDPAASDAVDQGVNRNLSDLTGWDKRVAEPVRLAATIARGTRRVTTPQIQEIAKGGIATALESVISACGSARRFYSSAPMRLAAAATIMSGRDRSFVIGQYRALCLLDFDNMTQCSQALVRQVDSHKVRALQTREAIARGIRTFDEQRAHLTKIQVSDADISASTEWVRTLLLQSIGENRLTTGARERRVVARADAAAQSSA